MTHEKYRSYETSLSNDELLILDMLFQSDVTAPMLRKSGFVALFNPEPHSLEDAPLRDTLWRWVREGIIKPTDSRCQGHRYLQMTPLGGRLWSAERRPIWERYCTESYRMFGRGVDLMTVVAVSSDIRDDFLRLHPFVPSPLRCRSATIRDYGLVSWHPFERLYVGLATYVEQTKWSPEEDKIHVQQESQHWEQVEAERSWWRFVDELQRFANL